MAAIATLSTTVPLAIAEDIAAGKNPQVAFEELATYVAEVLVPKVNELCAGTS